MVLKKTTHYWWKHHFWDTTGYHRNNDMLKTPFIMALRAYNSKMAGWIFYYQILISRVQSQLKFSKLSKYKSSKVLETVLNHPQWLKWPIVFWNNSSIFPTVLLQPFITITETKDNLTQHVNIQWIYNIIDFTKILVTTILVIFKLNT